MARSSLRQQVLPVCFYITGCREQIIRWAVSNTFAKRRRLSLPVGHHRDILMTNGLERSLLSSVTFFVLVLSDKVLATTLLDNIHGDQLNPTSISY